MIKKRISKLHILEFLSLTGGCTGSSESTHIKMSHCWKSHVTAQMNSLTYNQTDGCAGFLFETQIKTAIQVLRFKVRHCITGWKRTQDIASK